MPRSEKAEGLEIKTEADSHSLYELASPSQERKKLYQARSPSNREMEMPQDLKFLIDSLGFHDWWDNPVSRL